MRTLLTAYFSILLISPAAHADWQYAKWGMTPEQVVQASGGEVHVLPAAKRKRIEEAHLESGAEGTFRDGPLVLQTSFSFNTEHGGLACVLYGVSNVKDVEPFKASLIKRYGQPHISAIPAIGLESLNWEDRTDEIDMNITKGEPAFAMQCAKHIG